MDVSNSTVEDGNCKSNKVGSTNEFSCVIYVAVGTRCVGGSVCLYTLSQLSAISQVDLGWSSEVS